MATTRPAKAGQTELVWSSWATDTYGLDRVQEQANLFLKNHPDYKINVRDIGSSGYRQQVLTQLAGGVGPDVFRLLPIDVYPFADQRQLTELDPLLNANKSSWFWGDDLKPDIMDRMRIRGKLYGLPMGGEMDAMMINKDLFSKHGVSLPPTTYSDTSWTYDKVLSLAKQFTKRSPDGTPESFGVDIDAKMEGLIGNANDGLTWTTEDLTAFVGAEPSAINAIQWMADLTLVQKIAPTPGEAQGGAFDFENGRLAMSWQGVSQASYMPRSVGDKFDWDLVPQPSWGNNKVHVYLEFSSWVINAKTKHPSESWIFLQFINGPIGQASDVERGWAIPIFTSLDSRYNARIAKLHKNVVPAVDGLKHAIWNWPWRNPNWSEAWTKFINPALESVVAGKSKASDAMPKIKPDVDRLLKEGAARLS